MLNLNKYLIVIIAIFLGVVESSAQNDADVIRIPASERHQYRDGEVIVKFKVADAIHLEKAETQSRSKYVVASKHAAITAVLDKIGVFEMDDIMPLTAKKASNIAPRFISSVKTQTSQGSMYALRFDGSKTSVLQALKLLEDLDEVDYAEPNYITYALSTDGGSNDDKLPDPMYVEQFGPKTIKLPELWSIEPITTKRPVIAILDTGVDITHPDLADNIWTNVAEAHGNSDSDDDGNGFRDDIHGWDFVFNSPYITDNNGHGTHCAGIAGAVSYNGIGIMGANPDALIMPVQVMGTDGTGDLYSLVKGINYAAANGADVISMSLGYYDESKSVKEALEVAAETAILVAAAGNDNICLVPEHKKKHGDNKMDHYPCFPAAYNYVLGVQATVGDKIASYSNFDCDGPFSSTYDSQFYNYEVGAPGGSTDRRIFSTYKNGTYTGLIGTSMACPLVAGAISRLIQVKEYKSREDLFGDLIHTHDGKNINVLAAYYNDDSTRTPTLDIMSYSMDDTKEGDGDGNYDAGEIVDIYPSVRNVWGYAHNIQLELSVSEYEDPTVIELIDNNVKLGVDLSPYAFAKTLNPIRFRISKECSDKRIINLLLKATAENSDYVGYFNFSIRVDNGVDLGGYIDHDITLVPGTTYIVSRNCAIPEGVTMTVPGNVTIDFRAGKSIHCDGTMNIDGTSEAPVYFTGVSDWYTGAFINNGTIKYLRTNVTAFPNRERRESVRYEDCLFYDIIHGMDFAQDYDYKVNRFDRCCFYGNLDGMWLSMRGKHNNIIGSNGTVEPNNGGMINLEESNIFNGNKDGTIYFYSPNYNYIVDVKGNYLGSDKSEVISENIYDMTHDGVGGFGLIDLSTRGNRPSSGAHGLVWKVLVNGKDAQDEFEEMSPLGIGRHKFEVYFNRPMDKTHEPFLTMGVKLPYTQVVINEDASWNEDGTVYTAYLTLEGKNKIDGLNRIYVSDAQDLEHFEIPVENRRFNVPVEVAGSLETGMVANAGLGKVELEWKTTESDYPDLQGYNLYRYTLREETYTEWGYDKNGSLISWEATRMVPETILLNEQLLDLEQTTYIDYDVVPGTTYYYYVREMYTDLTQTSISNTVAATPLTATLGDSNGSGAVDVADIITDVAYLSYNDPQPFIFEAADVNKDNNIDIVDIVKTVNIIIGNPVNKPAKMKSMAGVTYGVKNGVLFIETPVSIGGVQVCLSSETQPHNLLTLHSHNLATGFEQLTFAHENTESYLAYSMSGRTLPAGRYSLVGIDEDAIIEHVKVVAPNGDMLMALPSETTHLRPVALDMEKPVSVFVSNLVGQVVASYQLNPSDINGCNYGLRPGVYIISVYQNGALVRNQKMFVNK